MALAYGAAWNGGTANGTNNHLKSFVITANDFFRPLIDELIRQLSADKTERLFYNRW